MDVHLPPGSRWQCTATGEVLTVDDSNFSIAVVRGEHERQFGWQFRIDRHRFPPFAEGQYVRVDN